VGTRGVFVNHVCHVFRLFSLQGCILIRIFVAPLDIGDGLIAIFKCSNATSLCCYMNYENDIDYFVVKA
jgi:hypothetical protein